MEDWSNDAYDELLNTCVEHVERNNVSENNVSENNFSENNVSENIENIERNNVFENIKITNADEEMIVECLNYDEAAREYAERLENSIFTNYPSDWTYNTFEELLQQYSELLYNNSDVDENIQSFENNPTSENIQIFENNPTSENIQIFENNPISEDIQILFENISTSEDNQTVKKDYQRIAKILFRMSSFITDVQEFMNGMKRQVVDIVKIGHVFEQETNYSTNNYMVKEENYSKIDISFNRMSDILNYLKNESMENDKIIKEISEEEFVKSSNYYYQQ